MCCTRSCWWRRRARLRVVAARHEERERLKALDKLREKQQAPLAATNRQLHENLENLRTRDVATQAELAEHRSTIKRVVAENMVLRRLLRHESHCYESAPNTIQLALAEQEQAVQRREELAGEREAAVSQREQELGQCEAEAERREAALQGQEEALRLGLQFKEHGFCCSEDGQTSEEEGQEWSEEEEGHSGSEEDSSEESEEE